MTVRQWIAENAVELHANDSSVVFDSVKGIRGAKLSARRRNKKR
jgi:hypothetical protein